MTHKSRLVDLFNLGIILFVLSLLISLCNLGIGFSDFTGYLKKSRDETLTISSKSDALKSLIRVVRHIEESSEEDLVTDDIFVAEFLVAANKFRAIHGSPKLKRNETLSKDAEEWATNLAEASDKAGSPVFNYSHTYITGESIWGGQNFSTMSGTTVATKWYSECNRHNWLDNYFLPESSHFTQLVWKDTESAGIAKVTSPKGITIFVVRYWPAGNWAYRSAFNSNVFPATVSQNDRQENEDCFRGNNILKFKVPRNPSRQVKVNITGRRGRFIKRKKISKHQTTLPSVIPNIALHTTTMAPETTLPSTTNTTTVPTAANTATTTPTTATITITPIIAPTSPTITAATLMTAILTTTTTTATATPTITIATATPTTTIATDTPTPTTATATPTTTIATATPTTTTATATPTPTTATSTPTTITATATPASTTTTDTPTTTTIITTPMTTVQTTLSTTPGTTQNSTTDTITTISTTARSTISTTDPNVTTIGTTIVSTVATTIPTTVSASRISITTVSTNGTLSNTIESITTTMAPVSTTTVESAVNSSGEDMEAHGRAINMFQQKALQKKVSTTVATTTTTSTPTPRKHFMVIVTDKVDVSQGDTKETFIPQPQLFTLDEYDDPFDEIVDGRKTFDEYNYIDDEEEDAEIQNETQSQTQKGRVLIMSVLGNNTKVQETNGSKSPWENDDIHVDPAEKHYSTGANDSNPESIELVSKQESLKLEDEIIHNEHLLKEIKDNMKTTVLQNNKLLDRIATLEKIVLDLAQESSKLGTTTVSPLSKLDNSNSLQKGNGSQDLKENIENQNFNKSSNPGPSNDVFQNNTNVQTHASSRLSTTTHSSLSTEKLNNSSAQTRKGNPDSKEKEENLIPLNKSSDTRPPDDASQHNGTNYVENFENSTLENHQVNLGRVMRYRIKKTTTTTELPSWEDVSPENKTNDGNKQLRPMKHPKTPVGRNLKSKSKETFNNYRLKKKRIQDKINKRQNDRTSNMGRTLILKNTTKATISKNSTEKPHTIHPKANFGRGFSISSAVLSTETPTNKTEKTRQLLPTIKPLNSPSTNWKDSSSEEITKKHIRIKKNKTNTNPDLNKEKLLNKTKREQLPKQNLGRALTKSDLNGKLKRPVGKHEKIESKANRKTEIKLEGSKNNFRSQNIGRSLSKITPVNTSEKPESDEYEEDKAESFTSSADDSQPTYQQRGKGAFQKINSENSIKNGETNQALVNTTNEITERPKLEEPQTTQQPLSRRRSLIFFP